MADDHTCTGNEGQAQPSSKRMRSTADIAAPTPSNYKQVWGGCNCDDSGLRTARSLFGEQLQWFVRDSYISLFDSIAQGGKRVHIINGSAGIGKSSFLIYALARIRLLGQCALLYFHARNATDPIVVFFPKTKTGTPIEIPRDQLGKYREIVGQDKSYVLVDGRVSFSEDDVDVTYIHAKSPSMEIGFFKKSNSYIHRWLNIWKEDELVAYGKLVGIVGVEAIVKQNMLHLGGICRYAFQPNSAQQVVDAALAEIEPEQMLKVIETAMKSKVDNQIVVDRLIHSLPPKSGEGLPGSTFEFASEYVSTGVAKLLARHKRFATSRLLEAFRGVSDASSFRGVIFEAFAARKLVEGGQFRYKAIASTTEFTLELEPSALYQKDSKTLNTVVYPSDEIKDKVVWPNPDYRLPAIDMLIFKSTLDGMMFQMTVATSHTLNLSGIRVATSYLDSVHTDLSDAGTVKPDQYKVFFAVPPDIYDTFSQTNQSFTAKGKNVTDSALSARVPQYVIKID